MTASSVGGLLRDCTGQGGVPVAKVADDLPDRDARPSRAASAGWGDHQVANITAFDEARTIGARAVGCPATSNRIGSGDALLGEPAMQPRAAKQRGQRPDRRQLLLEGVIGLLEHQADQALPVRRLCDRAVRRRCGWQGLPFTTDPPPPSDVPQPDTETNHDPHEGPRRACAAQDQKSSFFHKHHGYVTAPKQTFTDGESRPGRRTSTVTSTPSAPSPSRPAVREGLRVARYR